MSAVVKKSLSFPTALFTAVEAEASAEGVSTSAAFAEAAELWLIRRRGLAGVRAWESEHGVLTAEELAEADRALDDAGVGRS